MGIIIIIIIIIINYQFTFYQIVELHSTYIAITQHKFWCDNKKDPQISVNKIVWSSKCR